MLDIVILAFIPMAFVTAGFYARAIYAIIEPKHQNETIEPSG